MPAAQVLFTSVNEVDIMKPTELNSIPAKKEETMLDAHFTN